MSRQSNRRRRILLQSQTQPDYPFSFEEDDDAPVAPSYDQPTMQPASRHRNPARGAELESANDSQIAWQILSRPFGWLLPRQRSGPLACTLSSPDGESEPIHIDEALFFIGRSDVCDLRLKDESVGARHLLLQNLGGQVLFLDLAGPKTVGGESTILHNGVPRFYGWFSEGDELAFGPYALHREMPDALNREIPGHIASPVPPVSSLFSRSGSVPLPVRDLNLQVRSPAAETSSLPIDRPMTMIGRSRYCKLRLYEGNVSRVHASLLLTSAGLLALDLRSRSGMSLNGQSTECALLRAGDSLQIGGYELTLMQPPAQQTATLLSQSMAGGGVVSPEHSQLARTLQVALEMVGTLQDQLGTQSRQQTALLLQIFSQEKSQAARILEASQRYYAAEQKLMAARQERWQTMLTGGAETASPDQLRRLAEEQDQAWQALHQTIAGNIPPNSPGEPPRPPSPSETDTSQKAD